PAGIELPQCRTGLVLEPMMAPAGGPEVVRPGPAAARPVEGVGEIAGGCRHAAAGSGAGAGAGACARGRPGGGPPGVWRWGAGAGGAEAVVCAVARLPVRAEPRRGGALARGDLAGHVGEHGSPAGQLTG